MRSPNLQPLGFRAEELTRWVWVVVEKQSLKAFGAMSCWPHGFQVDNRGRASAGVLCEATKPGDLCLTLLERIERNHGFDKAVIIWRKD